MAAESFYMRAHIIFKVHSPIRFCIYFLFDENTDYKLTQRREIGEVWLSYLTVV